MSAVLAIGSDRGETKRAAEHINIRDVANERRNDCALDVCLIENGNGPTLAVDKIEYVTD